MVVFPGSDRDLVTPASARTNRSSAQHSKGPEMSGNDKLAGKAEELKGTIKEKVGDATDNPDLKAEGTGDQAAGHAKQAIGEAKEALSDVTRND